MPMTTEVFPLITCVYIMYTTVLLGLVGAPSISFERNFVVACKNSYFSFYLATWVVCQERRLRLSNRNSILMM